MKGHLTKAFLLIYGSRRGNATVGKKARLKEDIFKTWKKNSPAPIP
jgi:hypothetical protein